MEHNRTETVNLKIDGIPVTVRTGTTILEAAKKINVKIPVLCDHPELCRRAFCRLCVVECDKRSKLVAACAAEVWEGVSVVTNNSRLMNIRKTILELILANHPQDCLGCSRNTNCELQNLAMNLGIRQSPFGHATEKSRPQKISGETLALEMKKCVDCGRCVEMCSDIINVDAINSSCRSIEFKISTPYGQNLTEGPCVFCGRCASVCPVGAISHNDQTREVSAALESGQPVVAQISPYAAAAINKNGRIKAGTVTTGKIVSALKTLGFSKVYDANFFEDIALRETARELNRRITNQEKIPIIRGCTPGLKNFVRHYYPDLEHQVIYQTTEQVFTGYMEKSNAATVSIVPCLGKKYCVNYSLIPAEFERMIYTKGIDLPRLPEEPFDVPETELTGEDASFSLLRAALRYTHSEGIKLIEPNLSGTKVRILLVNGMANARKIMGAIRKGHCDVALVEIRYCPECDAVVYDEAAADSKAGSAV